MKSVRAVHQDYKGLNYMDFNGNSEILNHLIKLRRNPGAAKSLQADFDQRRLERVYAALATRPHWVGLRRTLPATGSVSAFPVETTDLRFDVIVTGAITNSSRAFAIERDNERRQLHYTGGDDLLRLRLNEYAGREIQSAGIPGVFYFPVPHVLLANTIETYNLYKVDNTVKDEIAIIGLTGFRVFPTGDTEALLNASELSRVSEAIKNRAAPEQIHFKVKVEFTPDGKAVFRTPKMQEPVIIRGFKTNLKNSLIRLNIEGELNMMSGNINGYVPIWTICNQEGNARELFAWQQRGIFVDAKRQVEGEVLNSIDGAVFDAVDDDWEVTGICETI